MSRLNNPVTGSSGATLSGRQPVKSPESFGISPHYKRKSLLGAGYPLVGLFGIVMTYFSMIAPSRDGPVPMEFKYRNIMPLIIPALILWAIWEVYRLWQAYELRVTIDERRIIVGKFTLPWSDIARAEIRSADGWSPAIVLHQRTGDPVNIPAAMEAIDYLAGIVRRHVKNVTPVK